MIGDVVFDYHNKGASLQVHTYQVSSFERKDFNEELKITILGIRIKFHRI